MREEPTRELAELLEAHRADAALRRESTGPITEAVAMLRETCRTIRLLLDELESSVGLHLELLDVVFVRRYGSRWWEQLLSDEEKP